MANNAGRIISGYSACNAPEANALLVLTGNTAGVKTTYNMSISTLFGNNKVDFLVANTKVLKANVANITSMTIQNANSIIGFIANNIISNTVAANTFASNNVTSHISLGANDVISNTVGANSISANIISTNTLTLIDNTAPTTASDTVIQGRIWYDDGFIYVATRDNTIKRVAIDTWAPE